MPTATIGGRTSDEQSDLSACMPEENGFVVVSASRHRLGANELQFSHLVAPEGKGDSVVPLHKKAWASAELCAEARHLVNRSLGLAGAGSVALRTIAVWHPDSETTRCGLSTEGRTTVHPVTLAQNAVEYFTIDVAP